MVLKRRLLLLMIALVIINISYLFIINLKNLSKVFEIIILVSVNLCGLTIIYINISGLIDKLGHKIMRTELELESIARFPNECPFPVLRFTYDCDLMYANLSGKDILRYIYDEEDAELPFRTSKRWCALLTDSVSSGNPRELEMRLDGREFLVVFVPFPSHRYVNVYFSDITRLKDTENRLRLFSQAVDLAMDMIIIIDMNGNIIYVNEFCKRITGYSNEELIGCHVGIFSRDRHSADEINDIITSKGNWMGERRYIHKDNTETTAWLNASAIRNSDGAMIGMLGIARDLTERRRIESALEKTVNDNELLLKEIHHRVKNNLQVISGLIGLSSLDNSNPVYTRKFEEIQGRIKSIALVHDKLYRSKSIGKIDFISYIESLTTDISKTLRMNRDAIRLVIDKAEFEIGINFAVPCALIINELFTNMIKYAFPQGQGGEIRISATRDDEGWITLEVSDDGIGLPQDIDISKAKTLGLLIVYGMVKQLRGTVEIVRTHGTKFIIRFKENIER